MQLFDEKINHEHSTEKEVQWSYVNVKKGKQKCDLIPIRERTTQQGSFFLGTLQLTRTRGQFYDIGRNQR